MQMPRRSGHDLDITTPLYVDVYIAWELHLLYSEYIQRTIPQERLLLQLFLGLKSLKERHAQEEAEEAGKIAREMAAPGGPPVRR
jgi:hypothetical protein